MERVFVVLVPVPERVLLPAVFGVELPVSIVELVLPLNEVPEIVLISVPGPVRIGERLVDAVDGQQPLGVLPGPIRRPEALRNREETLVPGVVQVDCDDVLVEATIPHFGKPDVVHLAVGVPAVAPDALAVLVQAVAPTLSAGLSSPAVAVAAGLLLQTEHVDLAVSGTAGLVRRRRVAVIVDPLGSAALRQDVVTVHLFLPLFFSKKPPNKVTYNSVKVNGIG